MSNAEVYIGLGGNLGNPAKTFSAALQELEGRGCQLLKRSSLYRTKPYGFPGQPDFLNAVAEVGTSLPPLEVLRQMQAVEALLGKKVLFENGPRSIDLDLLFHRENVLDCPEATVPHPGIPTRDFVLLPLKEIAPDFRHPVYGRTIIEMAEALEEHHFTGCVENW